MLDASVKSGVSEKSGVPEFSVSKFVSAKESPRVSKESVMFFSLNVRMLVDLQARLWREAEKLARLAARVPLRSWLIKHQPSNEYANQVKEFA